MHDRIVALFAPVLVLVAVALGSLLATETATRMSREAQLARHDALEQLADEPVDALHRWAEGGDRGFTLRTSAGSLMATSHRAGADGRLHLIPAGARVWPWTDGDWVLATSRPDGGQLELTFSTDPVQNRVSARWAIIAAGVLTVAIALMFATFPLTQWALRPVHRLDKEARRLADGHLDAELTPLKGAPELQRVADSFNEMARRTAAAMHRERAFVASASHHLGNLMTPLRLRIETMPSSEVERMEVLAELERLEIVSQRLLDLHRAEEDLAEALPVDVGEVVDDLLPLWEAATAALGISLRREGSAHAWATAVPGAIEEVLDNLMDNSLKYGEGSPITIGVVRGLRHVRLIVRDEGPGLSAADLTRAQARFWRGGGQQNKPGSGLGLAIIDALAVRCGGTFDLRSTPGRGLEGVLTLPRSAEP